MDDTQLYQMLRTDAEAGMKHCIAQYYALVYTICSGILRRFPRDTEECVNDSFVQLWRTLDKLKEPSHLRAYLCCIAKNQALSRYRTLTASAQHTEALTEQTADTADVLLALEARADAEALQRAILLLKEPDRAIFVRKYYYMESVKSLAHRFSLSEKAIDNILYRSKLRLKKMLEEESA